MTSAAAGYLTPESEPDNDQVLEDYLQAIMAAVSGLPGNLMRPRWQEEPPSIPDRDVTWAAVGIIDTVRDAHAYVQHLPWANGGQGGDRVIAHELLTILVSFYGPKSSGYATRLRDGLSVEQNREELQRGGFGVVEASGPRPAPELIKEKWLRRADLTVMMRREVRSEYAILSLLSAHGSVTVGGPADFVFDVNLNSVDPGSLDYSDGDNAELLESVGG